MDISHASARRCGDDESKRSGQELGSRVQTVSTNTSVESDGAIVVVGVSVIDGTVVVVGVSVIDGTVVVAVVLIGSGGS